MPWKHGTFGLSVLLSNRGAKLFSSRAQPLLRLDVLIVLISCCLSSITLKSQINHCVNINQGAESWRAGNSFREKEGIHSHTAWQTGPLLNQTTQKCKQSLEKVLRLSISLKGSPHRIWGTDQIFTRCVTCFWPCNPYLYSFSTIFSEYDAMNFRYHCKKISKDFWFHYLFRKLAGLNKWKWIVIEYF